MKNFIIALILLCPAIAFSAPDQYVRYAMEAPVSAHDFVLYKTNLELKDLFQKSAYRHYFDAGENLAFIDYSYEQNQYIVHLKSSIDKDVILKNNELNEVSRMLVLTAKSRLGKRGDENPSTFSTDLGRVSYKKTSKPENFEREIDKKIMVELTLAYERQTIECSSTLLSAKILCSESSADK